MQRKTCIASSSVSSLLHILLFPCLIFPHSFPHYCYKSSYGVCNVCTISVQPVQKTYTDVKMTLSTTKILSGLCDGHLWQELIRRWDSERELLYDDNIHGEASAYAHWTSTFYYKYLWYVGLIYANNQQSIHVHPWNPVITSICQNNRWIIAQIGLMWL